MPRLLTNLIRLKHDSKMYFTSIKNDVYPYKHIVLNIEIGDTLFFTVKGVSKQNCKDILMAKLNILTDCIEHLSKFDVNNSTI
jgi:hypothetical protein